MMQWWADKLDELMIDAGNDKPNGCCPRFLGHEPPFPG